MHNNERNKYGMLDYNLKLFPPIERRRVSVPNQAVDIDIDTQPPNCHPDFRVLTVTFAGQRTSYDEFVKFQ